MKSYTALQAFPLSCVSWQDPYVVNALHKEEEYLLSYEPDRLLAGFYETKGLTPKAERYGGWEQTELRGHIMGHYLKAMALTYERTGKKEFAEKLSYCFAELSKCQLPSGYLSAFPEELFDRIEKGGRAWAPWYTMHKIIAGLAEGYRATGDDKAAEVMVKLASWVASRTESWTEETRAALLCHEYGGMNDAMYDVYELTREERFLKAAHAFDEMGLFAKVRGQGVFRNIDTMTGNHANTMIPKLVGAMRRYEVMGEQAAFYKEAAEGFWDSVVNRHSYITGGHSDLEHFGLVGHLDEGRSDSNDETCNVYNMLKLSRMLYMATGDVKYMDFYETAFINMILASQNPETGMTTYFQSLLTGAFKIFGTPFGKFWCCTGTGMESFSKLGDSIYFQSRGTLYVNSYFSTTLKWRDGGLTLQQEADLYGEGKTVLTFIEASTRRPVALKLRIPCWAAQKPVMTVNGEEYAYETDQGYAVVSRLWEKGDVVSFRLIPTVWYKNLPDSPNCVGFGYGPLVLSALLGKEDMRVNYTGANMDVELATVDVDVPTQIELLGDREEWLANLSDNLVRTPGTMEFTLRNVKDCDLVFVPHFSQYQERYGIYWYLV